MLTALVTVIALTLMKIEYKYKILLNFLVVLSATTLLFLFLHIKRESDLKIERLLSQMQPYTDIIYNTISNSPDTVQIEEAMRSLEHILPDKMRVTILDSLAWVLYDNFSHIDSTTENHVSRPELINANLHGSGNSLRYSATLGREYLYFARMYPHYYIRTALDYKSSILPSVKGEKTMQLYIILVFLLAVSILIYITRTISRPFYALKEFVERVHHREADYDSIRFPKDEMGKIGEQIIDAFKQLEKTKRFKQELTHNIAHELKTPVTGIRGYLETLLNQEDIDKEKGRFFLERAYAQTLRLSSIVNDISLLNKIEESPEKFDYEAINIGSCIDDVRDDLINKLQEKDIKLYSSVQPNLEIEGNYMLIYSLFRNLVENSIDHAGQGVEIHVICNGTSSDEAFFTYFDTGKGVPENHIHRIFERFYRVEKGRSRKSGGSGLGLSIVRNSVQMHGGTISVSNRHEGGLRFDFTLLLRVRDEINEQISQSDA